MVCKWLSQVALVGALLMGFNSVAMGREAPVAKIIDIVGSVEYSRDGTEWKAVTRTKYLFTGYQIKSGQDGSAKLVNQLDGKTQDLGPNSEIVMVAEGVEKVSGDLSDAVQNEGDIFDGLSNKFATAQRYTTVRRSVTKATDDECDSKVRTIRELTLSSAFPDLVWRNGCPEYSYNLVIDGAGVNVAAQSTAEMIRYTVSDVTPGEHSYHVEVMDKDGTVYIPKRESKFVWLAKDAEESLMAKLKLAADDVFVVADLLEAQNMFVAAMDKYRAHFAAYPDDNDMRPLLVQSYQDLKLSNLKDSEARLYNAGLVPDVSAAIPASTPQ